MIFLHSVLEHFFTASPKMCFLNASCKGSKCWDFQFPSSPSSEDFGRTWEVLWQWKRSWSIQGMSMAGAWNFFKHCVFSWKLPSFLAIFLRQEIRKKTTSLGFFFGKSLLAKKTKAKPPTWPLLTDLWTFLPSYPAASWPLDAERVRQVTDSRAWNPWKIPWSSNVNLWRIFIFQTGGIFFWGDFVTDVRCYIRFFYLSLPFFGGFFKYYPQVFLQFGWISEGKFLGSGLPLGVMSSMVGFLYDY